MSSLKNPSTRLAEHLPVCDHAERHERRIAHPADQRLYNAVRHLDFSDSWIIRALFLLRGLPAGALSIDAMLSGDEFAIIEEQPPREVVIAGMASPRLKPIPVRSAGQFQAYTEANGIKIAWNFLITADGPDAARVSTETRVLSLGPKMKRRFGIYWFFIRPFSGWIRLEMLRLIARNLERDLASAADPDHHAA